MINRQSFVSAEYVQEANKDCAIPIGYGVNSTRISTVMKYIELAKQNKERKKLLEVGTGCGWQTALFSELFKRVFSVEINSDLAKRAQRNCMEYSNVTIKCGVDYNEEAPFNVIALCFSVTKVDKWIKLLAHNGILIVPLGNDTDQTLTVFNKNGNVVEHGPAKFAKEIFYGDSNLPNFN